MVTERVRNTAFTASAMKAFEADIPHSQQLFQDPITPQLQQGLSARLMRHRRLRRLMLWLMERGTPGVFGIMVCRTRALDDAVRSAVHKGVRQVIILGAGLDTRAYRMPELQRCQVWELDVREMQNAKLRALKNILPDTPTHVHFAPVDFTRDSLPEVLQRAGFDASQPCVMVWEGVTQYLPRAAVDTVMEFAGHCAPGSTLAFTYVTEAVEHSRYARLVKRMEWQTHFTHNELVTALRAHGLSLRDDAGDAEFQERYLRPVGRQLIVTDLERVAVAAS